MFIFSINCFVDFEENLNLLLARLGYILYLNGITLTNTYIKYQDDNKCTTYIMDPSTKVLKNNLYFVHIFINLHTYLFNYFCNLIWFGTKI